MTPLERMKRISPDLKGDFEVLKAKRYTWKTIAEVYGEDYEDVKEVAKSFGMAKRGANKMAAKITRPCRCTYGQAKAIADEVGLSVKTVLDRVYRKPELSLEEVRQYCIDAKRRGPGGFRVRGLK